MKLRNIFTAANYALGALLIELCFMSYVRIRKPGPIYIASAVIVAGPVEDLLNEMVDPDKRWIVDQVTSIGFLVFLILAVLSMD